MATLKQTLLIVEDDESIRTSLQELLEAEGFDVLLAENGEEALDLLDQNPPVKCILLDLSMPIMDGKTFLKVFASRFPAASRPPVLIMTAAGRHEMPTYPAASFIRKPFDVDDLMSRIQTLLEK